MRGYSFNPPGWPRAVKSKLLPFLGDAGVFIAQVLFMLAIVAAWAIWLWAKLSAPQSAEAAGGGIMWVFFIGAAILLLNQLLRGRISRRLRWEFWEWPDFGVFRREELRLQVLGVLSLVMLAEVAVLALFYVL